jgi:UDPglucose 6-dehydrogenase
LYRSKLPPLVTTGPETAELVKYASNAFLASKVSFINTIANIAQRIPGVDVNNVEPSVYEEMTRMLDRLRARQH